MEKTLPVQTPIASSRLQTAEDGKTPLIAVKSVLDPQSIHLA